MNLGGLVRDYFSVTSSQYPAFQQPWTVTLFACSCGTLQISSRVEAAPYNITTLRTRAVCSMHALTRAGVRVPSLRMCILGALGYSARLAGKLDARVRVVSCARACPCVYLRVWYHLFFFCYLLNLEILRRSRCLVFVTFSCSHVPRLLRAKAWERG